MGLTSINSQAQDWVLDLDAAKAQATDTEHLIVLVFQGSDWCAPCIRLDKEIWSTEAFQNYAKENLVMVKADFPRRKENKLSKEQAAKNAALADTYNEQGAFPLVVVMNKDGKILDQSSYEKMSPEEYVAKLEALE